MAESGGIHPRLDNEPDDVLVRTLHAARALLAVTAVASAEAYEQVTPQQLRALVLLRAAGPMTAGALAERLGVTPSAGTRLIARIARGGWVRRTGVRTDRRQVRLSLTPHGTALVDDTRRRREQALGRVLDSLEPDERRRAAEGFALFARAVGEPVPESDDPFALPVDEEGGQLSPP